MIFECRQCGKTTADIDKVLDGTCECGCSSFRLVSNDAMSLDPKFSIKERVRRDLYDWIDINLETMTPEELDDLSVSFMRHSSRTELK